MISRPSKGAALLFTAVLVLANRGPADAADKPLAPADGTVQFRAVETRLDGSPLTTNTTPYYGVKASDHASGKTGEVGTAKQAPPLPEIPNGYDIAFAHECRKPENKDKAQTLEGWTVNHYKWCRAVTIHWQRIKWNGGVPRVTDEIIVDTTWLGYADARNRKFHFFARTGDVLETIGEIEDDARISAIADCAPNNSTSSCTSRFNPDGGVPLADVKEGRNNTFETIITDTSKERFNLTGDAVAELKTYSWFNGRGGAGHVNEDVNSTSQHITSRCDSARFLRTSNACIFNNVSPYLTYDKNDRAYPVDELVDHIRHAQDNVGAPGAFRNGKPAGASLTRTRDAQKNLDNRNAARDKCRSDNPSGWNWRVRQCDEYPVRHEARFNRTEV